jgi:hypothetical protein
MIISITPVTALEKLNVILAGAREEDDSFRRTVINTPWCKGQKGLLPEAGSQYGN